MADTIVIEGVRRYEGEYPLDLVDDPLTTLDWRWIKKISGYLPLTVNVGWAGQDPDLVLALAVIAVHRAGKVSKDRALALASELEDEPAAAIRLVLDSAGADADDQAVAPEPTRSNEGSGERSSPTSDQPGQTPSATGTQGSERSAGSVPATLVI